MTGEGEEDEGYVEFDVADVSFFSQLLSVVLPNSTGASSSTSSAASSSSNASSSSLSHGGHAVFADVGPSSSTRQGRGERERRRRSFLESSSSSDGGDCSCLYISWTEKEMRVRGVSKGRDVYSEVTISSSFFLSYIYKKERKGRAERRRRDKEMVTGPGSLVGEEGYEHDRERRKKRKKTAQEKDQCNREETRDDTQEEEEERDSDAGDIQGEGDLEEEEERRRKEQVMIPVKELLNALMLFGDHAHLRMRYTFNEGVLSLLLQERLEEGGGGGDKCGGGGEEEEEEAVSEISIKTFDVSEHEQLPDLRAFWPYSYASSSSSQRSSPDFLRMNPQVLREVFVDLLGGGEEESGGAAAAGGGGGTSIFPPASIASSSAGASHHSRNHASSSSYLSGAGEILLCVYPPPSQFPSIEGQEEEEEEESCRQRRKGGEEEHERRKKKKNSIDREIDAEPDELREDEREREETRRKRRKEDSLLATRTRSAIQESISPTIMRLIMRKQSLSQEISLGLHPLIFPRLHLSLPHKHIYKLKSLLAIVPALKLAHGLRIEWVEGGMLLVQILVKPDLHTRLFLHFYILATFSSEPLPLEEEHLLPESFDLLDPSTHAEEEAGDHDSYHDRSLL